MNRRSTCRRVLRSVSPGLLAIVMACAGSLPARAQTLSIQGDRFAIDGSPKFLVFMSFFGAMGAPNIAQDFKLLRSLGFDGVRIWPNLDTGPQLMNGDGSLRSDELQRLKFILERARDERLVVDVSFTYEHISGMTPATALTGIVNATNELRSYNHILFDIQNERNVLDRRYMSEDDVGRIFRAVKAAHPQRITTADNSIGEDYGPQYAADFTARLGLDVVALHESRRSQWYTLPFLQSVVSTMKQHGRPAYLQEPNSTRDNHYEANDRADYYMQAVANAKLAGAAAWCFHTLVAVTFTDGGPNTVEERLRRFSEPEWNFVTSLMPRVMLRATNGVNYLIAESGGGGAVRADRTAAGPGSWEILTVANQSGGPLVSGDRVAMLTASGSHYLQAVGGGGAALRATGQSVGAFETFIIERSGGGVIRHGEQVTLRSASSSLYVVAENGGGGGVNVNSANRGTWETFTILFTTPHSSEIAGSGSLPFGRRGGGGQ
jgi:hypothetical protein